MGDIWWCILRGMDGVKQKRWRMKGG
uniref:Uncharacterized protein n=1 Tax=Anguilla anguilla TaxID=7936 RepID=A0A0E9V5E1_ANGAN